MESKGINNMDLELDLFSRLKQEMEVCGKDNFGYTFIMWRAEGGMMRVTQHTQSKSLEIARAITDVLVNGDGNGVAPEILSAVTAFLSKNEEAKKRFLLALELGSTFVSTLEKAKEDGI